MFNRLKSKYVGMILIVGITFFFVTGCAENEVNYEEVDPEEIATVFLAEEYERIYYQTSKEFQNEVTVKQ